MVAVVSSALFVVLAAGLILIPVPFVTWHQENRRNFGCKVAVDIAHGAFVFIVGGGADTANDKTRADFARVADQEAVFKYADADIGKVARNRFEHGAAFVYGVGVAFFRISRSFFS